MESPVFDAVEKVLFDKGFRHVKPLGKGGFGDVLSAISPDKNDIAVKIIKNENSWPYEESIWPTLRHKNVLELLDVIDVKDLKLKLYLMPKHPFVLDKTISSITFLYDKNGLYRVKRWLSDVLDGLEYMHTLGYAHLDINSDNVLITSDDEALLCDFSGISMTGVPLRRLCCPREYRPPEWYNSLQNVEGSTCDIWLFGLMTLQVLTGHWPVMNMKSVFDEISLKKNVEPILLEALQKNKFFEIMKNSFPCVHISDTELSSAHDFVAPIMKWNPADRPSLEQIKRHNFLVNSECRDVVSDMEFDAFKTIVTNPFLDGWVNPVAEKGDMEFYAFKTIVTNPFLDGWVNPVAGKGDMEFYAFKTIVTNPFLDGWVNPVAEKGDMEFYAFKTVVTNPFLDGWVNPVGEKGDMGYYAFKTIVTNPFLDGWVNPVAEKGDMEFDDFKTIVTNPFLDGWINPVAEKNKSSIEVSLYSENHQKYISNPLRFNVETNPFLQGWTVPVKMKNETSIKETLKTENGRENHRSFKEFEMVDEYNKALHVSKRQNDNFVSKLPHVNSDEVTATKIMMPPKKGKFGGRIKQWIEKKWYQALHKKNNYVILSAEPDFD